MSAVRKAVKVKIRTGQVVDVPLKNLTPDPHQPRKAFDDGKLQALADNIRERGILQPILVREEGGKVLIVDGERRWRAAKLAKLGTIPTLRVDGDDAEQLRLDQVSVNQLREQLKPMEFARVLRGLRDAGKTANEIAATLAKQGYKAVKPNEIDQIAASCDLPEWLHAMIDAEEIGSAPALKLQKVLELPGLEAPLRKRLHRAAGYTGSITASSVEHEAKSVLSDTLADLNRTDSWARDPVLFAWKTRCKGCEHLLTFEGSGYCRNAKLFKEHQAEAKAEGLLPGGKRPEKPKPVTGKAAEKVEETKREVREASLSEKARDYLHGCLTVALLGKVGDSEKLQLALVIWRALKNPGSNGSRGSHAFDGSIPTWIKSLEQITTESAENFITARYSAALNVLAELPWRETHAFARQLAPHLQDVWTLDLGFLDLFRKAELVHLAVKHECNPGDGRLWDRMKADDMKAALLTQPERLARPAILVDLYEGEIYEPYNPRGSWHGDDADQDEAVCIGCGCTHTDPCDEGCGWATGTVTDDDDNVVAVCDSPACAKHVERFEADDLSLSPEAVARIKERAAMRGDEDDDSDD